MSLPLSSLCSHFFKHLTYCNSATTFFSFLRRIHCLPPPNRFSFVPSARAARQQLLSRLNVTAVNCSTLPLHNGAVTAHDAFILHYLSVRICCPRHVADVLSESLLCFGASSTTIDELDSHESGEEIWISSTFDVDQDVKDCISRAADSVGLKEIPNYKVEMHDHTDWIKQTQNLQAINIVLNPGLAFGTGEHPTTKLCLLLLRRLVNGGEYFLDYGTGSGVLAIAALKFGADLSVGFDIERQAITSARHNAALNNIGPEKLLLSLVPSKNGPEFENECPYEDISSQDLYNSKIIAEKDKYDVVIANILLYPLLDLAERIVSYAKPGAVVGVSGIISEQVPTVVEHYSQFLDDINVSTMDDWACITGSKKTEPGTT
ncbi:uncharacterized protein LOC105165406 isoform X2 [Sesamum indicum]|uniref:ETFB lysine methyltransferase n=1 Tax=Sesamum indicum TaxID=4182 RepID=A0A8M8V1V4_SESIN|nr:uncharacterized protein LOC105165406 isoform X2 [Sesamum indicum]